MNACAFTKRRSFGREGNRNCEFLIITRFQCSFRLKIGKPIIFLFLSTSVAKWKKIKRLIQFYLCDNIPKCGISISRFFWASTLDAVDASAATMSQSMRWWRTSCRTTITFSDSTIATSTVDWIVIWIFKWLHMHDYYRRFSREDVSVIKWPQ